ncbi:MAG: hypothetical protein NTY22_08065 [Proteobacteria bacterium]|nr:hypothetical protein [Pseudomonadota bacterium]
MGEKKLSFKITGTCYIPDTYTQNDMIEFNNNRTIPESIKKLVTDSIFNRKRSFHLSIVGDRTLDWKEVYYKHMEDFEKKFGQIAKRVMQQFFDNTSTMPGNPQKVQALKDLLRFDCSGDLIADAMNKTMEKKIDNFNYFKKILFSSIKRQVDNVDIANGHKDRSTNIINRLDKYNEK